MEQSLSFSQRLRHERLKQGWSQAELANKLGCDTKTIRRWENGDLPQPYYRKKIGELFNVSLEDFGLIGYTVSASPVFLEHRENLEEAPDLVHFCGREAESTQIEEWITRDKCRLVAIFGMGGIGKTTLAARIIELVRHDFAIVIWRTLKNAPPLASILQQCLHFLVPSSSFELPIDSEAQIALLLDLFQKQRCLLILDNVETILLPEQRAGHYLSGFENYARLLQRVGETRHQSCLMLTSREKPGGLAQMEDYSSPVRSLVLGGMSYSDGQELLKAKSLQGAKGEWIELNQRYGGNPLALKLVSEPIREIFAGQIGEFLQEQLFALGDINDLLRQQFQRFSSQERELITWLAIEREKISLGTLRASLFFPSGSLSLLDALESLHHRSLIEKSVANEPGKQTRFFLQPVILEYATADLVLHACEEFVVHTQRASDDLRLPETWQHFAFLQATAADYIREIQQRMILGPICDYLLDRYGQIELENHMEHLLAKARQIRLPDDYLAGNVLNMLVYLRGFRRQHTFPTMRGFDFSHLSIRQAYLQGTHLSETNFSDSSFRDTVFTNTFGAVPSVVFSPDGSLLAVGTAIGEIWLYDVIRGVPKSILRGHRDGVWAIAFSPSSNALVSGSDDRTVRHWDLTSGECTLLLTEHTNRVRAVAFSPDGSTLVSGSNDHRICVWETKSGRLLKILHGHVDAVWSLAFHPSGHLLASGGTDHTIRIWNLDAVSEDGAMLHVFSDHTDRVRSVKFTNDGSLLASASDDQTVRLWDIQKRRCLQVLTGHTNRVWSIVFHPDGRTFASGSEDGTIRFWQSTTGECFRVLQAHNRGVRSLSFSPDGSLLASGGEDQAFRLWESQSGNSLKIVQGYINRILSIDFTSTGQLISSGDNQEIRLWDIASGQCLKRLSTRGQVTRAIAASPNGVLLASVGGDQQVHLWNRETGQHLDVLPHHTNWGRAVDFSPDGTLLASGGEDTIVILWHIQTGQKIQILRAHLSWLRALAFSKDSTMLASGGDDRIICLWDVATGACLRKLAGHKHAVRALAFHPTQRLLFSGSEDCTIRCWDTHTGACLRILEGHTDRVLWIDVHPDGNHVASCSDDLSLRIWNLGDYSCQVIPFAHRRRIRGVTYAPDGKVLASCSDDGTIKLWNTISYEYTKTLLVERPYERMNVARVTGLTDAQYMTLKALGAVEEESTIRYPSRG